MGKKSALLKYRAMETKLADVRKAHVKGEPESTVETELIAYMDACWYNDLTAAERTLLSKES